MGAALLGASEAHRVLPGPGFAAALVVFAANATGATTSRQAAPGRGDFCGDEERSAGVGARSALRDLTRRYCLNVAPAKARSELSARPRGEHHSAVVAKRRPPQHEPLAGAAWRDALNSRRGGCCRRPQSADCRRSLQPGLVVRHARLAHLVLGDPRDRLAQRRASRMNAAKNAASAACAACACSGSTWAMYWSGRTTTSAPCARSTPRWSKMSAPFGSGQNTFS